MNDNPFQSPQTIARRAYQASAHEQHVWWPWLSYTWFVAIGGFLLLCGLRMSTDLLIYAGALQAIFGLLGLFIHYFQRRAR